MFRSNLNALNKKTRFELKAFGFHETHMELLVILCCEKFTQFDLQPPIFSVIQNPKFLILKMILYEFSGSFPSITI